MRRFFALAVLLVACVPHRDVPPQDIPNLGALKDVMDVQATVADPQFKKIGDEAKYVDADWTAFADLSTRIQATSTRAKAFSKGPGFDQMADRLHEDAVKLGAAANAKEGKNASDALAAMKATCRDCHKQFR